MKEALPRLKVLARSLPDDKLRLVKLLKEEEEIVAVTGDGTNDAKALKEADVGLSMGSGSNVAKEASDIVIMDDNFNSIVKSVLWGRCVFENIRKFLQFQLTVNFGALLISLIGAVTRQGKRKKKIEKKNFILSSRSSFESCPTFVGQLDYGHNGCFGSWY